MTAEHDARHRLAAVLCALAAAGSVQPAFGQEAGRTVTLEEATELALRHNPQVAQATGAVETAASGERTAWAQYLPRLSVSTGASLSSQERFNPQTNTTVTGSADSYNAGLSASVDLFTGGRRGAEMDRARAETGAAEANLVEQRYAVILSAKSAFFDVLRSDELVGAAEANLRRAEEAVAAAERRLEVGSATRSDVLRAQLERTNARQALLEAENQRRTAAFALGHRVGADGAVGAEASAPLEPRPLALPRDRLVELAVGRAPAVRAAEASLSAAGASESAARTQYLPTVTASAGYDFYNQDPTFAGGRKSWGLRLGISYPIFNRFQRVDAVASAGVQADVARTRLSDTRRAARSELEQTLAALDLARQQIALAEEAVRVAREDLRVQEERYRLGAATILERLTSQASLEEAERDLVAARYDYQIARAEVEALVGREL